MNGKNIRFVLLFPAIVWIMLFAIYPFIHTLQLSFFSGGLMTRLSFVGLKNYLKMFSNRIWWSSVRNTLIFVGVTVGIEFVLGLGLALLLNEEIKGRKYFRILLTLPVFATPIAIGYLGRTIFFDRGGAINAILQTVGVRGLPWLSDKTCAFLSVMSLEVWQWTPFCFIVLLAGLQSLPEEAYEAAILDTNSRTKLFWYITFPLLKPVITVILLLRLIEAFKAFDIAYSLTGGGPGHATELYSLLTYRVAFKFFNFGSASAYAIFLLVMVLSVCITFMKQIRALYEQA